MKLTALLESYSDEKKEITIRAILKQRAKQDLTMDEAMAVASYVQEALPASFWED